MDAIERHVLDEEHITWNKGGRAICRRTFYRMMLKGGRKRDIII
jgi:hypothetical protein